LLASLFLSAVLSQLLDLLRKAFFAPEPERP
jgi:hypothetical protein